MDMIDYSRINRSINFYEEFGFKRIESPWTVTKAISGITKPKDKIDWEIKVPIGYNVPCAQYNANKIKSKFLM